MKMEEKRGREGWGGVHGEGIGEDLIKMYYMHP